MKTFRSPMSTQHGDDDGISLVEVLVAMMIFALISVGIAYSLGTMMVQVRDARAREIATNIAAQEIDIARAAADVTNLLSIPNPLSIPRPNQTVNGTTFTIVRTAGWITDAAEGGACGIAGGASVTGELQYKSVAVKVSWPSSGGTMRSVTSETLITPKSRLSGATRGTIIVSVRNGQGLGQPGIGVTVSPSVGSTSVSDAEGCIYITNVTPTTYTVSINASSYVDTQQAVNPSRVITVGAGKSGGASFQIELAKPLTLNYGTGTTAADKRNSTNLDTSLIHASDPVYVSTAGNANASRTLDKLYPFADGYQVVAGRYVAANDGTPGCLSPHPGMWEPGDRGGAYVASPTLETPVPAAGKTVAVGLGAVTVSKPAGTTTIYARSEAAGPAGTADPGCGALTMQYQFTGMSTAAATVKLALPYGSWKLYSYTGTVPAVTATPNAANALTVFTASDNTIVNGAVVTLDPRIPATPPVVVP